MGEKLSLDFDYQVLANVVEHVCDECCENGPLVSFRKSSDYHWVRFSSCALRTLFSDVKNEDDVWKTKDAVVYEALLGSDCLVVQCLGRNRGISTEYKRYLKYLTQSFSQKTETNSSGKIILHSWTLCQNNMEQANVRKCFSDFLAKDLLEWENALYEKLGHVPPHKTNTILSEEPVVYWPSDEDLMAIDGGIKDIHCTGYERDRKARAECIRIFGAVCKICGFDFSKVYGPEFEGKIEVHHIDPLFMNSKPHKVNPATDLIPVCSNCHTALHSKKDGVYKPEELAEKLKVAKYGNA